MSADASDASVTEQGVRFVAVGAFNTVFGYGSFALMQLTLGEDVHYMVLLVAAWILNVLEAYLAYRYLVFKVRGAFFRALARFSLVYVGAFVLNLVALPVGVDVLGLPVLAAQAVVLVVTVVVSFFAHRTFSFRRSPADMVR